MSAFDAKFHEIERVTVTNVCDRLYVCEWISMSSAMYACNIFSDLEDCVTYKVETYTNEKKKQIYI